MVGFSESIVEDAALAWLETLGYAVLHGPTSPLQSLLPSAASRTTATWFLSDAFGSACPA